MKKVVRLTETDLVRLVKKVISEQNRSLVGMSGFVSEQSNENESSERNWWICIPKIKWKQNNGLRSIKRRQL